MRLFKKKEIILDCKLHCPDGFDESVGFFIPSEIDSFIKWVNLWNKEEGYTFTIKKTTTEETIVNLLK